MRRAGFLTALFIILMLTAALVGILYFSSQLVGSPFPPYDIFNWLNQLNIPGWQATIDGLTSFLTGTGIDLVSASETSATILSVVLFFIIALIIGLLFYAFSGRGGRKPDTIDGLTAGLVFAAPVIFLSLLNASSTLQGVIVVVWLGLLFLAWGLSLSNAFGRAMRPARPARPAPVVKPPTSAADEGAIEEELSTAEIEAALAASALETAEIEAAGIDRREFLVRFGLSTAAIASAGAAGGAMAYEQSDRRASRTPLPLASPEFREAQRTLLGNFRRFVLMRPYSASADQNTSNVVALGTEFPDQNYVSVWIGNSSPIVIYESLDSARNAFGDGENPAGIYWLDS